MTTLPNLQAQMREDLKNNYDFEQIFGADSLAEKSLLSFIEKHMVLTAEETYKAVKLDKDNGIHEKTGMPVYKDFNKGIVTAWNEAKESIDEAYETFTYQVHTRFMADITQDKGKEI